MDTNSSHGVLTNSSKREAGQALAEYAVMLGMLLVLFVLVTIIGLRTNAAFSWIASTIH